MSANHIDNTAWRLTAFVIDGDRQPPLEGTQITAIFCVDPELAEEPGQRRITGSAGCNQYFATYTLAAEPPGIAISPPGTTRIFCAEPDGVMLQELRYVTLLEQMTELELLKGTLILRSEDSALEFEAILDAAELCPDA